MPDRFGSIYTRQIPARLINCLNESGVRYEILHEPIGRSAQGGQRSLSPGPIDTVVLRAGRQRVLAVIPAEQRFDLKKFAKLIGIAVRVETEDDFKWLFPDCTLKAIPPFGNLYGLATWVDSSLAENEYITFLAGTPSDSIRLAYSAYIEIVEPRVGKFTTNKHGADFAPKE